MAGGSAVGEFRGRVSGFKAEGSGRSAARGRPELKPAALKLERFEPEPFEAYTLKP